ncbi:MAG: type 4a pilus biogenesis protein PilO [Betaproteobacteria bacterium]|nr:type 4a pilus biogenesis protein PilO [Betaproteobacteria bacterium]
MKRIHSAVVEGAASLGWPGVLGLGLLVLACGFYFSTLRSEQSRLDDLRLQIEKAREQRAAPAGENAAPATPSDKLAAFYGFFPKPTDLPDLLQKVFAAAKAQGLKLENGEYRVLRDNAGALNQFQLTLPVHGTYPQIRKFVDGAMAEVATLSLESIQFERQKVGDALVDARVKLVVYVGKRS